MLLRRSFPFQRARSCNSSCYFVVCCSYFVECCCFQAWLAGGPLSWPNFPFYFLKLSFCSLDLLSVVSFPSAKSLPEFRNPSLLTFPLYAASFLYKSSFLALFSFYFISKVLPFNLFCSGLFQRSFSTSLTYPLNYFTPLSSLPIIFTFYSIFFSPVFYYQFLSSPYYTFSPLSFNFSYIQIMQLSQLSYLNNFIIFFLSTLGISIFPFSYFILNLLFASSINYTFYPNSDTILLIYFIILDIYYSFIIQFLRFNENSQNIYQSFNLDNFLLNIYFYIFNFTNLTELQIFIIKQQNYNSMLNTNYNLSIDLHNFYINLILKNIQIFCIKKMSNQVLSKYSQLFISQSHVISTFQQLFDAKLWNELSIVILQFLFDPQVKAKVSFDFYTQFVKKFQKNIDPIKLLKIIKEVMVSLSDKQRIQFLKSFQEKQAFTQQTKTIVQALEGLVYVALDFNQCSDLIHKIQTTLASRKDVDQLVYSVYYEFCMSFYAKKQKFKQFYTSALQYLAYTPLQQMEQKYKVQMLVEMAVAALVSNQIYNFSELLEQPSLVSLKNSSENWMYDLLEIFNKGDIGRYQRFEIGKNKILVEKKQTLEQKIRIMAFLELVFNLPKSDRVIRFSAVEKQCAIPLDHVEFMIMKTMALGLIKGSIDQLMQEVTVSWVAPKVLQSERINVMLKKFEEWDQGVENVYSLIKKNLRI